MTGLHWLDILLVLILGLSTISGFSAGMVRIAVGLGALTVGFLGASWFYGMAGESLSGFIANRAAANAAGFAVIFLGAILIGSLVAAVLRRLLSLVGLSWADRLLGAMFGLVRGTAIVVIGLLVLTAFLPQSMPVLAKSRVASVLLQGSELLSWATPYEIRQGFRNHYKEMQRVWGAMRTTPITRF